MLIVSGAMHKSIWRTYRLIFYWIESTWTIELMVGPSAWLNITANVWFKVKRKHNKQHQIGNRTLDLLFDMFRSMFGLCYTCV